MTAVAEALVRLFEEHHGRLRRVVEGLGADALDQVLAPETNSIAVLVTHTCGSELDWLHIAAGRSMERERAAEFRTRKRNAADLAATVDRASSILPELVRAAVAGGLDTTRRTRRGREVSAAWCLMHALEHTAEHVGQVELTRQLVTRR